MNRHLHIICLDVPWPPDYGGAIDMFYKIKALWETGCKIHLHYFSYNHRGNPTELNRYCETITIYNRKKKLSGFSSRLPYIVESRINSELVNNLQKDNYPLLIEGTHCTGILKHLDLDKRKVVVRLHNDEGEYYRQLAGTTGNLLKKVYFYRESWLLKKYEQQLPKNLSYACISKKETEHFNTTLGLPNAFYLPPFIAYQDVKCMEGIGSFCLYHGNLSVPENEKAAIWLLTKVFPRINVPLVIAGKNPSKRLSKLSHLYQHACLVANPSNQEINDLVQKAQVNVLPSFSTTGIKFKLLHSLFEGRHCVVNANMISGTGLESACHTGGYAGAIASIIHQLYHQPFTPEEIKLRYTLLGTEFNNRKNINKLIAYLW